MGWKLLSDFQGLIGEGGAIMWPLIGLTLLLWFALGYRWAQLRRGNRLSVRVLIDRYRQKYDRKPDGLVDRAVVTAVALEKEGRPRLRRLIDDAFFEISLTARTFSRLIKTVVITAPLLGLLGTVMGMIETFESLAEGALYTQTGGIASGISKALLTTQMGLVVAVPGLVIGRILDRREAVILRELDLIKDIICPEQEGESDEIHPEENPDQ